MKYIEILQQYVIWNNSVWNYVVAVAIFFLLMGFLKIFQKIILHRVKAWSGKTKTNFDDAIVDYIQGLGSVFYLSASLWISSRYLNLSVIFDRVLYFFFVTVLVYEAVHIVEKIVIYSMEIYGKRRNNDAEGQVISGTLVQLTKIGIRVVFWSVGLIFILSNFGVNVTSLIASLGIGGIAIALAVQNILTDMFSSFSIYLDKPFEVGDFIVVGTDSGIVEKIGLKSTRLRTLRGEELVVSNKELTTVRVQNFKKLEKRREVFTFGVEYGTSEKQLEKIPNIVKKIVESIDIAEFDRCHFNIYGDFSLIFETVYFIKSKEYNDYMDAKQQINLAVFKAFKKEGIGFAFPTQTVFVHKKT